MAKGSRLYADKTARDAKGKEPTRKTAHGWRAGYIERCPSGAVGGSQKPEVETIQGAGSLPNSIQDIIAILTAIAALVTAIVTFIISLATQASLDEARKNSFADILLRLDEAFLRHEDVREKLAPGGDWHRKKTDPTFPKGPNYKLSEDLIAISTYMGLFERIQELIDREVIHIDEVDGWFGDRLMNIVINTCIQDRLINKKDRWSDFIKLLTALVQQREQVSKRWLPEEAPLLLIKLKSN